MRLPFLQTVEPVPTNERLLGRRGACRRLSRQRLRQIGEHILDEDPIPRGGIADQHVRHRTDQPAVLQNRAARHECVQVGTTKFD